MLNAVFAACTALAAGGIAAGTMATAERYRRAEAMLPWHLAPLLHGVPEEGAWQADGARYDYAVRRESGRARVEVDARSGVKRVAAAMESLNADLEPDLAVSPDRRRALRERGGNLYVVSLPDGAETPLTKDGEPNRGYASTPDSDLFSVTRAIRGERLPPVGVWSPDSTRFLTYIVDQRNVRTLPFVQSVAPGEAHQVPRLHEAHVALPGDSNLTLAYFRVIDVGDGSVVELEVPAGILADSDPAPVTSLRWSDDGRRVYVLIESRGYRTITYYEANAKTGRSRTLVSETSQLPFRNPTSESGPGNHVAWPLQQSEQLIFYSERDGWGHLYLYDTSRQPGRLVRRLTSGEWAVQDVLHIDEQGGWVYFLATARERGRDPYFSHAYRVRLDGSGLALLTPEDAHHDVSFAPDGRSFIDTYSTVDEAPVTLMRSATGKLRATLERADTSALEAAGWHAPQRFSALAADGKTPLFGTLYRPRDLDPNGSYPLIDAIYHGDHTFTAPYKFTVNNRYDSLLAQPLAELGFVVMILDARGTGLRGQRFQDFSYGARFGSAEALEDHVSAARRLAAKYPYIDISRAGIYGHSWGGYRAARAMLQFPDFYKVAVASAGSHDNFLYANNHERTFGMPSDDSGRAYLEQSNLPLAARLKGHLLLVHGDVDDSVHPAHTLQLADAFIRANKDFDLMILPGANHRIWDNPYFIRRRWDYFVEHLMGEAPPVGFAIRRRETR